jgi:uncharacterized membrane protein
MAAAAATVWLTAAIRKVLTGSVLLFLLQFPVANLALCVVFARTAPTGRPLVAQLAAEVVVRPDAAPLRPAGPLRPGLTRSARSTVEAAQGWVLFCRCLSSGGNSCCSPA